MVFAGLSKLARATAPIFDSLITKRAVAKGLAPPTDRKTFLRGIGEGDLLEIGPFDVPALIGKRVKYFDILDTDALRARATHLGRHPDRVPHIDYSSPTGDLAVVDRTFDAVFSSHVLEHQPDLIKHLNDVFALLTPGGRYHLILPDKRYCFDHFLTLSTTEDVVAAQRSNRTVPTSAAVLAHRLDTTHNRALLHWMGLHGRTKRDDAARVSAEEEAASADQGTYIDVHTWIFDPERFRNVMRDLALRNEIGLRLVEVSETAFAYLEYFAILERPAVQASGEGA